MDGTTFASANTLFALANNGLTYVNDLLASVNGLFTTASRRAEKGHVGNVTWRRVSVVARRLLSMTEKASPERDFFFFHL